MATVTPNPTQGAALYTGSQAFYAHDDAADSKDAGGTYSHQPLEFSATEAESWCDWFRYVNGLLLASPIWTKYTKTYLQLAAAAMTNDIEILSLPAGGVVHGVKVKHTVAFAGGSVSAYAVRVGITGQVDRYCPHFDVFQAVANTTLWTSASAPLLTQCLCENHGAVTSVRLAAESTGDDLENATAGSVDVWLLTSKAT